MQIRMDQMDRIDWNQARAFVATAEEGTLSAAARALGLTQPTLGRQVAALEQALGLTLFTRSGRSLLLTEAGEDVLEELRPMARAAERARLVASGNATSLTGTVTVTATDLFAAEMLPPMIARLGQTAPGLRVHVVASNSMRDLLRQEADIAIRHVEPEHPDLIARKVADYSARLYGARALLRERGRPESLEDLKRLPFVGIGTSGFVEVFQAVGLPVEQESFVLSTDSGAVGWSWVRRGLGLSLIPDDIAAHAPEVEVVLPDLPPVPFSAWLVTHRAVRTNPRIRLVYDHLVREIRAAVSPR